MNPINFCSYFVLNGINYFKFKSFKENVKHLEKVQAQIFSDILKKNKHTQFGKKHKFNTINNYSDYQNQIPLTEYSYYQSYIDQIKQGKKNILTSEKVINLSPTSGTTDASKLIPYTQSLLKQYNRAIGVWLYDIYKKFPQLKHCKSFWIITPTVTKILEKSNVTIGFEKDSSYFGKIEKTIIQNMMATPDFLSEIIEIENYFYLLSFFLLKTENLGLISVWNPTIIPIILNKTIFYNSQIINDYKNKKIKLPIPNKHDNKIIKNLKFSIKNKRLTTLNQLLNNPKPNWSQVWSQLNLISCWTDAWAKEFVPQIKTLFPAQHIQGKGLMATEAIVSIPLFDSDFPVLTYQSHFYEFIEMETKKIYLAHQLEENKQYTVAVTTAGGLYRYNLNDIIEIKGFYNNIPQIEFISKHQNISDTVGEKLNENHVAEVFKKVFNNNNINSDLFFLAPEINDNQQFYGIFVYTGEQSIHTTTIDRIINETDNLLSENFHYRHARNLQQLSIPKFFKLTKKSKELYLTEKIKSSQISTIKPTVLERKSGWSKIFDMET